MGNNYQNYVCPHCFYRLENCKCNHPPWTLIQVDAGIQNAVRELNQKGYDTQYCCEGHFNFSFSIYITFHQSYNFPEIPEGFKLKDKKTHLEYIVKGKTFDDFESDRKLHLEKLNQWVKQLPVNKE